MGEYNRVTWLEKTTENIRFKSNRVEAVDVSEGTASAQLAWETRCWYAQDAGGAIHRSAERDAPGGDRLPQYWKKNYDIPGKILKGGAVLFQIQMPDDRDGRAFSGANRADGRRKLEHRQAVRDSAGGGNCDGGGVLRPRRHRAGRAALRTRA